MIDQERLPPVPAGTGSDRPPADKLAWMRNSLGPGDELIGTRSAYVLRVGDRAWKPRKPVRREPMDYGTLDSRRTGSETEVRLNRRLAPRAYLGSLLSLRLLY